MPISAAALAVAALESLGTGTALRGAAAVKSLGIAMAASAPAAPAGAFTAAIFALAAWLAPCGDRLRLFGAEKAL